MGNSEKASHYRVINQRVQPKQRREERHFGHIANFIASLQLSFANINVAILQNFALQQQLIFCGKASIRTVFIQCSSYKNYGHYLDNHLNHEGTE